MMAKALLLLCAVPLALACAGECDNCELPSCKCERFLWTCRKKCLGDFYGKDCGCNWQGTSTSETNIIIPDTLAGLLTVVPSNDKSEVVLGGWSGLWVGTDRSGNSYRKLSAFDGQNVWAAAKDGSLIVAGGPTGLYRSTDNGKTAQLVSQGLSAFGPNNFAAQGNVLIFGKTVFAATFEGLFVSRQQGASGSWSLVCDPLIEAAGRDGCRAIARDIIQSADGQSLYVTYQGSTKFFAVDIATGSVSVLVDDAAWCPDASEPWAVCSTWTFTLFGSHLVVSPRPGPKVKAIDLAAPAQGWVDLQVAESTDDVSHLGVVNAKLYVQYSKKIYSYATVASAPQLVADTQNSACRGFFNELRFNVPVLPLGGGFTLSPNGEYLVTGAGSGAYRVINQ